ncbi:MAG: beta-galactosidase [Candidatus Marinimicrobia bacterium]|nr:beta-galactosidase [Candidatus Neomarinimicrobiota bacterium]MCF7850921.1 beta-galactosidase [Candidatus Neomarinimicrobiota bacterium]
MNNEHDGYYTMPVGMCEDYPEETTTEDIIKKDLDFLKAHDIKFMRISFGWDAIENEEDKYDWLFWDEYIRTAVEDYGITLIPYICYTPDWNSTAKGDPMAFWNHTPIDYDEFGEFIYDLVTRYKPWIETWELWNEPDISAFWSGNAADLAKLTKIGSKAVRRADPTAKVVLAGLAWDTNFTRELFKDHDISQHIDVVNIHNYFETWHPDPVEHITDYVDEIYSIVAAYGDGQPVWMAEVGYSTWRMDSARVSNDYVACYEYEHTPEYQAVDLFKRCALVAATHQVSAIAWYELKDLPMGEDVIGDNNNRNLGVCYVDHTPKPAAQALKTFNVLFNKPFLNISEDVKVSASEDLDTQSLSFKMNDGSVLLVAWLPTWLAEEECGEPRGAVADQRSANLNFELPFELSGDAVQLDELGNSSPFSGANASSGKTTLKDVELTGGKLTIIKIKKS